MIRNKSAAVVGGDMRQFSVYEQLLSQNNDTVLCAFEKCPLLGRHVSFPVCRDALYPADIVILPLPAFINGALNAPFSDEIISPEALLRVIPKSARLFGGRLGDDFIKTAEVRGFTVYDYISREEFAVMNAVPTAEGALAAAIANTDITIAGSRILVCGYGRIGKALSRRLHLLGARVSVSARKPEDLSWIAANGMKALKTGELYYCELDFDIIINTVPHMIFDKKLISHVKNGCVMIDLASVPGGIDLAAANSMGIKAIHALSLPGKTAPASAGRIILSTIENMLDETEMIRENE
ncbi:MAG: dipicolinate synthase subunit DpsA [Clostridia bacterium]|nr:dipicolinate synthase subunit DpsA [Clostridia bacterium]